MISVLRMRWCRERPHQSYQGAPRNRQATEVRASRDPHRLPGRHQIGCRARNQFSLGRDWLIINHAVLSSGR
ncbi:hypothetical protein RRG08_066730 [Elysia crispata]|uniref:Uncharacterized protein n=1 Tax=Elysia crispata TaxID=231223 RepID=A0AAE1B4R3_9GAST|nr:hypothetical protein RRG08_066730 [Elysia crispata]